jgi:hypothetical protein
MKPAMRRGLVWAAALVASAAVFSMYLRPDLIVTLANQLWACF